MRGKNALLMGTAVGVPALLLLLYGFIVGGDVLWLCPLLMGIAALPVCLYLRQKPWKWYTNALMCLGLSVLAVWLALFLYHTVNEAGGICTAEYDTAVTDVYVERFSWEVTVYFTDSRGAENSGLLLPLGTEAPEKGDTVRVQEIDGVFGLPYCVAFRQDG